MLETAAMAYVAVGVCLSLMDAQGVKISGRKSERPWIDACIRVGICLLIWPVVVACWIGVKR